MQNVKLHFGRKEENIVVLILNAKLLNELIASYGPFVMNTQEDIRQTFEDYNNGKLGVFRRLIIKDKLWNL